MLPHNACSSILKTIGSGTTEVMLKCWNPTMGQNCDTLQNMAGNLICVSPPGIHETGCTNKQSVAKAEAAAIGDTKDVMQADAPTTVSMVTSGAGVSVSNLPPLPNASNLPTGETWTWSTVTESLSTATAEANQTQEMTFAWLPDPPVIATECGTLLDAAIITLLIARSKYCPFEGENSGDFEYEPSEAELEEDCQSAWDIYCDMDNTVSGDLPATSNVPASCHPVIITLTTNGQTSSSIPGPPSSAPITSLPPPTTVVPTAPRTTSKTSSSLTFNPLLGGDQKR